MSLLETNILANPKRTNSWGCVILSAPHRTVRASRTCKSGMNNAARKIEHPILGAAESLPLLNEEFAKSLFRGGKDSSAPTSNFELQTPNSKLNHHSPPPPYSPQPPLRSFAPFANFAFLQTKDQHLYPRLHLPSLYFFKRKERRERKETQRLLPVVFICLRRKRRILTSTLQLQLHTSTSFQTLFAFLCALCELCVSPTIDPQPNRQIDLPLFYFFNAKNAENAKKRKGCYR